MYQGMDEISRSDRLTPARSHIVRSYHPAGRSRRANREAADGVAARIGNTPLIPIRNVSAHLPPGVRVFGKAEFMNPGGSVKDRPAWSMIRDAARRGLLAEGRRVLDATSGNTGIAYAMIGSSLGIPVTLAMPANASPERKHILRAFGAELILTDAAEGTDGAQRLARELAESEPNRYVLLDQYNNDANWRAHYETTAPELIEQSRGGLTHFVAALGTTGTFTGVGRRLKAFNPGIRMIAVQPDSPLHGIEGVKHLETAAVPGIFDASLIDDVVQVSTEAAMEMARRLAREEGLLVGVSAGANITAALKLAEQFDHGIIVTILCDSGSRYLSDPFWNETEAAST